MCLFVFLLISTFFFFNATATTEIYTLSLHDALPISPPQVTAASVPYVSGLSATGVKLLPAAQKKPTVYRSEEHTSELQSQFHLVCRLLLEKKKKKTKKKITYTKQHHQSKTHHIPNNH